VKVVLFCGGYGMRMRDGTTDLPKPMHMVGPRPLLTSDISDWTITFVNTGLDSPVGERLRRVRHLVEGEEMFLANYADVLTDLPLDSVVEPVLER